MIPPSFPQAFKCLRRVGYLFPHECQKQTPIGCLDCQGGLIDDPYLRRRDRYYYDDDYDVYPSGLWVGSSGMQHDFTEGDGENLVKARRNFEDDMSAS